jgi:hypothetical protein
MRRMTTHPQSTLAARWRAGLIVAACLWAVTAAGQTPSAAPTATPNAARRPPHVLMIAVDDLRPELGCYGATGAVTPHFDRLAARGVRFDRAYCNIAVCGASRSSLFKGLRPTAERFLDYATRADVDAPDTTSLPLLLRQHGYTTVSNGKVYHHRDDDMAAWSEPPWRPNAVWNAYRLPANEPEAGDNRRGPAWEAADVPDDRYTDHEICTRTIANLERLVKAQTPCFVACGFTKPHLPFVVPKKYWDLHPPETIRLPDNPAFPAGLAAAFAYDWGELRKYRGIPAEGPVAEDTARSLIRGYRAGVSFIDAQVGRLLDALDRLGIADETIVVLWGDHGWQLGEHGMWCKHTNFEVATRTPLLVAAPAARRVRRPLPDALRPVRRAAAGPPRGPKLHAPPRGRRGGAQAGDLHAVRRRRRRPHRHPPLPGGSRPAGPGRVAGRGPVRPRRRPARERRHLGGSGGAAAAGRTRRRAPPADPCRIRDGPTRCRARTAAVTDAA